MKERGSRRRDEDNDALHPLIHEGRNEPYRISQGVKYIYIYSCTDHLLNTRTESWAVTEWEHTEGE